MPSNEGSLPPRYHDERWGRKWFLSKTPPRRPHPLGAVPWQRKSPSLPQCSFLPRQCRIPSKHMCSRFLRAGNGQEGLKDARLRAAISLARDVNRLSFHVPKVAFERVTVSFGHYISSGLCFSEISGRQRPRETLMQASREGSPNGGELESHGAVAIFGVKVEVVRAVAQRSAVLRMRNDCCCFLRGGTRRTPGVVAGGGGEPQVLRLPGGGGGFSEEPQLLQTVHGRLLDDCCKAASARRGRGCTPRWRRWPRGEAQEGRGRRAARKDVRPLGILLGGQRREGRAWVLLSPL